jgi:hypothetical protein
MAEIDTADQTESGRLQEEVRKCEASRQQRRAVYAALRMWRDKGTNNGPKAKVNKLVSHLDTVSSYLYAPDLVRFGIHLPPAVREQWLGPAEVARDEFRERWRDSGADLEICQLIDWALVYNSTVAKVQADPGSGFRVGYIQPWDFGVGREDVPKLDEQDVFCHWYSLSIPQTARSAEASVQGRSVRGLAGDDDDRERQRTLRAATQSRSAVDPRRARSDAVG